MATTKILLENRRAKIAQPQIVKIRIYHNLKTALISLEIKLLPSQWSESLQMVINHPEEFDTPITLYAQWEEEIVP